MGINLLRFIGIILASLTVGMRFAHTLEFYPKLQWDAELYFVVQNSLYRYFGILGPFLQIGAILIIFGISYMIRKRRSVRYSILSAGSFVFSLVVWFLFVSPAAKQIQAWNVTHTIPTNWILLREQWQTFQSVAFCFDFIGLCLLAFSVLSETKSDLD